MKYWMMQLQQHIDILVAQLDKKAGDRARDGGPIEEEYIIQMYDKEGRWVDVATVPGNR
jgi:hypothetical protein